LFAGLGGRIWPISSLVKKADQVSDFFEAPDKDDWKNLLKYMLQKIFLL